jgi:hypothetical protein
MQMTQQKPKRFYVEKLTDGNDPHIHVWAVRDRNIGPGAFAYVDRRKTRKEARICCLYWNAWHKRGGIG